jgi:hypothetical protein
MARETNHNRWRALLRRPSVKLQRLFFWKNRKVGCTPKKENSYYLAESPKPTSHCEGCLYGTCVSFCMKKCMNEVFGTKMPW